MLLVQQTLSEWIHRHTGGLEICLSTLFLVPWIHRHTGGLEKIEE
ncbi:hypothetical protein [uncultured Gammaproteobacteria bacterium]|nr:hypothetical protein [uncultured Gammaproteobacteria bacterium]CAC9657066.1 hypothetical protein [uncultured Gammaproteobacteria bacterium]